MKNKCKFVKYTKYSDDLVNKFLVRLYKCECKKINEKSFFIVAQLVSTKKSLNEEYEDYKFCPYCGKEIEILND